MTTQSGNSRFKKKADPTPEVVVSERMRQELLVVAVRNRDAFLAIRPLLDPPTMRRVSQPFAVIWKAANDYYDQAHKLADLPILSAEVSRVKEDEEYALSPSQTGELGDLIDLIFDDTPYKEPVETSKQHTTWAIKTARKLLTLLAADKLKESLDDPASLIEMPSLLRAMSESVAAIGAMETVSSGDLFAPGWDVVERKPLYTTGVAVIDAFIGGSRGGEVYGFLGPYGSCKTTIAVQAVVTAGKQCAKDYATARQKHQQADDEWIAGGMVGPQPVAPLKPMAVYASYETPIQEFRERCLALAGETPRNRLMTMDHRGVNGLRGPDDPLVEYEKTLFAEHILNKVPIASERERVLAAAATLNNHVVFLDMTGKTEERQHKGKGGVPELAADLAVEMRDRGAQLYSLWLDHAAAMCEEEMIARELDTGRRRELLRRIPKLLGNMIAGPMDVGVFVLQQLSGEANSRGSTAKMDHTDSDECKSFGMYLDFAITCTRPTADQIAMVRCTKHRRTPPMPHKFVRVVGEYNYVADVTDTYTMEGGGLGIVSKADKGMIGSVEDIQQAYADAAEPKPKKNKKSGGPIT